MSENTQKELPTRTISKHEFYFEAPLYEIMLEEECVDDLLTGDVDAYSSQNHIETTYAVSSVRIQESYPSDYWDWYRITLTCKRKGEMLRFFVWKAKSTTDEEIFIKVGQYPSLADLQFAEIGKKYDKALQKGDLQEFKKAIGLAAHGVGAGSFVYLRRIFEKLIWETFRKHQKDISITDDDFLNKRMTEKIDALKAYLPSQLVEMKSVYGILSKGVHELEEQECLTYFPALKLSIELILDQKIEIAKKQKRDEDAKKQISAITQKISSPSK